MIEKIYSVTEFNKLIKKEIEDQDLLKNIFLKGEISGITYYRSGHLYFTLKDKNSQIKCTAFNYKMKKIPENLKDGQSAKIFCDVGFYEVRGELQVLVRHIEEEDKMGELFLRLEKLKKEMRVEGYFDQLHKKEMPKNPKNIGVVTSLNGAALQDIIKTIKKRDDRINIYVAPSKVQGIGAKEEIIKGIELLNKIKEIDFIIAGRGGGSIEDLWCFNEKEVAMAFFNSKKPIISAVGHEIDNLLSDLTADIRATTPTGAVEMSVPDKKQLEKDLGERKRKLIKNMSIIVDYKKKELQNLNNNYYFKNYLKNFKNNYQTLIDFEDELKNNIEKIFINKKQELQYRIERVVNLNPIKILATGYSITTKDGIGIKKINLLKKGDIIVTRVQTGVIRSEIKELIENEK